MNNDDDKKIWIDMVKKAIQLHNLVKPVHSKIMITNRGCEPNENLEKFYNHIHPIEDLLQLIENPDKNKTKNKTNPTIDKEFELKIYTKRWSREDKYKLKRIKSGWNVSHISISGDCDKSGFPYLYKNFEQDSLSYPNDISGYLEFLWEKADEDFLTEVQVQNSLNEISEWISICEKNSPSTEIWKGYK